MLLFNSKTILNVISLSYNIVKIFKVTYIINWWYFYLNLLRILKNVWWWFTFMYIFQIKEKQRICLHHSPKVYLPAVYMVIMTEIFNLLSEKNMGVSCRDHWTKRSSNVSIIFNQSNCSLIKKYNFRNLTLTYFTPE